jgi:hypothetical protein
MTLMNALLLPLQRFCLLERQLPPRFGSGVTNEIVPPISRTVTRTLDRHHLRVSCKGGCDVEHHNACTPHPASFFL